MTADRPNWWENLTLQTVLPALAAIAVLVGIGVFVTGQGPGTLLAVGVLAALAVLLMASMLLSTRIVEAIAARIPWP